MTSKQMLEMKHAIPDYFEIIKSHKTTWRLKHYIDEPKFYIDELQKLRDKIMKKIDKLNKKMKFNNLSFDIEKIIIEGNDNE